MKRLKSFGRLYLGVGSLYGLWAFISISLRYCGVLATECLALPITTNAVRQLLIAGIAVFRGLLWLPEMIIAVGRDQFLDWVLLRNGYYPNIDQLIKMFMG